MQVEEKLRELLLPVFGLSSLDEIKPDSQLVNDLGAESIDFVEIAYIIESNFGVNIKTNELMIGGVAMNPEELFAEGRLTAKGAEMINQNIKENRFKEGQTRRDLFSTITVRDLANMIQSRKQ